MFVKCWDGIWLKFWDDNMLFFGEVLFIELCILIFWVCFGVLGWWWFCVDRKVSWSESGVFVVEIYLMVLLKMFFKFCCVRVEYFRYFIVLMFLVICIVCLYDMGVILCWCSCLCILGLFCRLSLVLMRIIGMFGVWCLILGYYCEILS